MESITSVNLHQFGSGLLVEVVGEGVHGDIIVRSVELDLIDPEDRIVQPRTPLAAGEASLIEDRLIDDGYRMDEKTSTTAV